MTKPPDAPELPAGRRLVPVAEVARPHGLHGELRLKVYNPDSTLLEQRPPVWLRRGGGALERGALETVRRGSGGLLVRLPGIDDRAAAAELRGVQICVERQALPATEPDEYYVCDLEGCTATLDGRPIGTVVDVRSYPTCDVLVLRRLEGGELEVPMHVQFVADVRPDERRVELRTIDGLA